MLRGAALLSAVVLLSGLSAGEFNKKINLGEASPTFVNLEGTDGKKYNLDSFKKDVLVIAITCNHCPVAQDYEDRILAFAKKYAGKIDFVAINVNNIEEDRLPEMIKRARDKGYTFPYLYDPSQKIAKELGATVTPEFFVLDKSRKFAYTGAMDDKLDPDEVKVRYLEAAVEALLKGGKVDKSETRPRGCGIKYE